MKTQLRESLSKNKNDEWQIVVVDDEEKCRELFARILRADGYTVRTAPSGADALRQLRELPADLVLTDMVMPKMNGMQLLANVKERYPDTDVVVLTGFGTIEDSLEAMRRGAADFLPKPFQPHELSRLTAACLRAKRANCDKAFLKQSDSMLELARLLAQTADVHVLPAHALELACQNFDADSAILLAYEPVQESLSVLAHAGGGLTRWGQSRELTEQGLDAIRQRTITLSAEPSNGDCYAYVPLWVADQPRGVLCLRRSGGPWFHEKSSELLEIFATHLALALESAQLYETASQQVSDLEELITVSRSLSLQRDPKKLSRQILSGAKRLTRAEICAVLLVHEGQPLFSALPSLPDESPLLEAIRSKLLAVLDPLHLTADKAAGVFRPRRNSQLPPDIRRKLVSFMGTPLTADPMASGPLGVLGVFSSQPKCFSVDDAARLSALADNAAAAVENAATLNRISAMYHESIEMLGRSADARNTFSLGHSSQVRTYASALARALGLNESEVYQIEDGALLHDIGKICIPEAILNKSTPLSDREFEIVAAHPIYGANMFEKAPHLGNLAPIIRYHHEHFNGTGYPDGLRGEKIPPGARVVALGDVFDALISHRPYRPAASVEHARHIIELKAGLQFDPEMTRTFLSLPLEELIEH